jgi:hypothetical protein
MKYYRDLYRRTNERMWGYQPRSNLVKVENDHLVSDSHNIFKRWKNYFSRLLTVHRVSDFRQIEIHTAEPLVPDSSSFDFEIAIAKLKRYKSLGSYQIPAELIQAGSETYRLISINSLILFGMKNCLISGRSLLLYHFTRRAIKLTVVIIEDVTAINLIHYFMQYPAPEVESIRRKNYWRSSLDRKSVV